MSSPRAFFVFKLRENIVLEGDLLLSKLELEAFLPDAIIHATDAKTLGASLSQLTNLEGFGALEAHTRANGKQAYTATGPLEVLPLLIRSLSFVQRIYCLTQVSEEARFFLHHILDDVGNVLTSTINEDCLVIQAIPHYTLIELSDIVARHSLNAAHIKENMTATVEALLDRTHDKHAIKLAHTALSTQSTTSHLAHDIHYYKAKFFPRMARSLLNVCAQRLGQGQHRAIDNFAGSGTALLEASTLNIPSVGLDIDPLSMMIAQAKLEVAHVDSLLLSEEAGRIVQFVQSQRLRQPGLFDPTPIEMAQEDIVFPAWLMKNRKMTPEIAAQLSREINVIRVAIATSHPQLQNLLRIFLSDAISRKIRMRFMGTGVGRFSLSFAKAPMTSMFVKSVQHYVKVIAVYEWLRQNIHLCLTNSQVMTADARNIPHEIGTFDILVTSPPYLPASSGRESYTKARAPSLIALGVRTHEEVDFLVDDAIGAMNGNEMAEGKLLDHERVVVEWLRSDSLRSIKAAPVAKYFLDMRQSFSEMYRILQPGAVAVVVSGKTSTFYQYETREALMVVNCAEILADEAQGVGFEVEALHDIQLFKSNRNARPRSLDDYYETLILLRKPVA